MTVAALVIAILALIVAGLSATYTRRQAIASSEAATSATATAIIETDRRHDELTPRFTPRLETMANSRPYYRLRLRLDTAEPLTTLGVRLLGAPVDVQFSNGQRGTDPDAHSPVHEAFAVPNDGIALRPYDEATWQIELNSLPNDGLRLQVDAEARGDVWHVPVSVSIPPEPSVR
jgi:hypothetical protein